MFEKLINAIKSFFAAIFGKKSENTTGNVSDNVSNNDTVIPDDSSTSSSASPSIPSNCILSDGVKSFIISGHSTTVQDQLLDEIKQHEEAGDCEYTLSFKDVKLSGYYKIYYGNISASGVSPTENVTEKGKLSTDVRNFLLSGHTEEEQKTINEQIDAAEAQGLTEYYIHYARGYYKISNGNISASGVGL